jgi:hypothetical protein
MEAERGLAGYLALASELHCVIKTCVGGGGGGRARLFEWTILPMATSPYMLLSLFFLPSCIHVFLSLFIPFSVFSQFIAPYNHRSQMWTEHYNKGGGSVRSIGHVTRPFVSI